MNFQYHINNLQNIVEGEVFTDKASKIRYATDASVYYEEPQAVIIPKSKSDIKNIIDYAAKHKLPLIPRAAGTSLAGQVVGNGIVIDISKYLTRIIEINKAENYVVVEPGVILDNLNRKLKSYNLFFGPETSTANRCMISGMVGNNACGLHAVKYGTTREHILEVSGFLSDGSYVTFKSLNGDEFSRKCELQNLEGDIYRNIRKILSDSENIQQIKKNYPEQRLTRRNNGYALDLLVDTDPFIKNGKPFNFAKLIAGSEGTLMFITEIKLNLVEAPPENKGLVCAHFTSVKKALKANIVALKYGVTAVELMDDTILNAALQNAEQRRNSFFIEGNPKAILMIEFAETSVADINSKSEAMISEMQENGLGYHFPVLYGVDIKKAWNLRKAGLGVLANIGDDKKSVTVVEDTAVHPDFLPEYIEEFAEIMNFYGEDCVYYAHAGTGEIHLRPRLDLKKSDDVVKFKNIAWDIARLVKKYRGSLSGEHGDGRLRGEFIPFMLGDKVYSLLKELKHTWDIDNIFNPGKIIDTPPMDAFLRYKQGVTPQIDTVFDFSDKGGIIKAVERCNGSGDCRKLPEAGGTMCPSYMATRDEKNTTRGRANVLREFFYLKSGDNPFNSKEIYEALDLCLSCKACKTECPSSVDVAKLKAEFLQHWYDNNGISLRTRAIANISKINFVGAIVPQVTNFFMKNGFTSRVIKKVLGFAPQRSMPLLQNKTLRKYIKKSLQIPGNYKKEVVLFVDEFTNYNDTQVGIAAIRLLTKLGYKVSTVKNVESGRTYLSKGLLRKAKKIAVKNVTLFKNIISDNKPLIGIEPSAILTFRDEYPDLVGEKLKPTAFELAKNCLLIEEFIVAEFKKGNITKEMFDKSHKEILLHGHCQQKAVATTKPVLQMLSIPENYFVKEIPSGCCGMAGSFGYEKEHYELSMKIGEMILFPAVRKAKKETVIVASGTSCRHQIKDGTQREALHPVEVLFDAIY
jgi:FAD/FMN-containing dehydrogenase/Fe-S oxidoreductase